MADAGGEVAQEDVAMNVAGEPSGKDEGSWPRFRCVMPAAAA